MKASELPYSERQAMLRGLRTELGETEYNAALGQCGEDFLLEVALHLHDPARNPLPFGASDYSPDHQVRQQSRWARVVEFCKRDDFPNLVYLLSLLGSSLVTAPIPTLIVVGVMALVAWKTDLAMGAGIIIGVVGTVCLVGWGLWRGVPWLTFGVVQWFSWLTAHT